MGGVRNTYKWACILTVVHFYHGRMAGAWRTMFFTIGSWRYTYIIRYICINTYVYIYIYIQNVKIKKDINEMKIRY